MTDFAGPGTPLDDEALQHACAVTDCPPESLMAVLSVETSGVGYLPDRRPVILFERHIFHRLTDGAYDADHPDISAPSPGGSGPGGDYQFQRLAAAVLLDRTAALESASWGLGQIMGMNFASAGFADVSTMVDRFILSERDQLVGMASFLRSGGMATRLADDDWAGFARLYNGPNYAANHYDAKLQAAFQRFQNSGLPDLRIRAAQIYLHYNGYSLAVDGVDGPATRAALASYQSAHGLPVTGAVDDATLASLASPE